ncbi:unnamed protein product, partial [Effrenium voratum]
APIIDYFGLPSLRTTSSLTGSWQGVLRLRWREGTLYLAGRSSPLLRQLNLTSIALSPKEFELLPGSRAHRLTGLQPPAPLPPFGAVSVAPKGASCALHCAGQDEVCEMPVSVARCSPPLTAVLRCRSCSDRADSASFPGLQLSSDTCYAGATLPNSGAKYGLCSAQTEGVQRLCVCRRLGKAPLALQSASQFFPLKDDTKRSRSFRAAKERRSRPNLKRFGQTLKAGAIPSSVTPKELAVLIVAEETPRASLQDTAPLQRTLESLSRAEGFVAGSALLAHADGRFATAQLAETFQVPRVEVSIDKRVKGEVERRSALYKGALTEMVKRQAPVVVLAEGCRVAPDALWYFAQLSQVQDDSLLAANGWNDQGLAPFAADETVVLRTDWFAGAGWMISAEKLRQELLPQWHIGRPWESFLREGKFRKGRQFLTPEVSRVVPDPGLLLAASTAVDKKRSQPFLLAQYPLAAAPVVDLGDVERLTEEKYKRLFFIDWPGEGLLNAKLLSSLQSILEGKVNSGGPFRLIYRNVDAELDTTWRAVAQFFGLWPDLPMRGSYHGVVRLRWRDTVIFLVPSSSKLCTGEFREALLTEEEDAKKDSVLPPLSSQIFEPMLFPVAARPVLVPAAGELVAAELPGSSCAASCEDHGLRCLAEDLAFINNCDALSGAMGCRRCEPGEGSEQPAQEVLGVKAGRCLYNTNFRRFPGSCSAAHEGTRRLCVCREPLQLAAAMALKVTTTLTTTIVTSLPELEAPAELASFHPEQLAVLVIATGQRPRYLEQCLDSLVQAYGFNPRMVFVSQDGEGTEAKIIVQRLKLGWRQVDLGPKSFGERVASHYKAALQYVLTETFRDQSALVIMEEDVVVSLDFLLYFAQLKPLLQHEDLLGVSAWNENALGPYSASRQRLLRVDSFSGVAWMVSTQRLRELLPKWPRNFWQKFLGKVGREGRQFIIPELPRVQHAGGDRQEDGGPLFSTSRDLRDADLGDLQRMSAEAYGRTLAAELQAASLVEDLADLPAPLHIKEGSNLRWRVHYQSDQPESDGTWRFVARFLQLPEDGHPAMLDGVTKLLWGRGFLYMVASSSGLALKARLRPLPAYPLKPEAFQEAKSPLMVAPNAQLLAAERAGQSCRDLCASRGEFCAPSDLRFVNRCDAMKKALFCERCERNMGSDQPAVASSRSSRSYGACLYNGDVLHHPITCEAAHRDTRRLCVCRRPFPAGISEAAPAVPATEDASSAATQAASTPTLQQQTAAPKLPNSTSKSGTGIPPTAPTVQTTADASSAARQAASSPTTPQQTAAPKLQRSTSKSGTGIPEAVPPVRTTADTSSAAAQAASTPTTRQQTASEMQRSTSQSGTGIPPSAPTVQTTADASSAARQAASSPTTPQQTTAPKLQRSTSKSGTGIPEAVPRVRTTADTSSAAAQAASTPTTRQQTASEMQRSTSQSGTGASLHDETGTKARGKDAKAARADDARSFAPSSNFLAATAVPS